MASSCTAPPGESTRSYPVSLILTVRSSLTSSPLITSCVSRINALLSLAHVPEKSHLTPEEFVLSGAAVVATLLLYYVMFGKRHRKRRKELARELRLAQMQVHILEEKLLSAKREDILASTPSRPGQPSSAPKQIRIFMDGAFDVMHYGHMNAFRLGRSLGTYLIVGVNSDESITRCKGPPIMNDEERLASVEGCKFVDEVVPDCPYIMTSEYLDHIFDKYDVDYVVHGDDPCIVDGRDVYESAKRRGRYRSIPRTEGVSTTDIVGRMLLMTKEHHMGRNRRREDSVASLGSACSGSISGVVGAAGRTASFDALDGGDGGMMDDYDDEEDISVLAGDMSRGEVLGRQSKFLTTSMMLRLFSAGVTSPEEGARVIYVDGAWDMFHCGHIEFLKVAKQRGDYLIVGIHGDTTVNSRRGQNLPLMNLHERVLSVLGCKYVDDVLIDAPFEVTADMVASLRITEVVHGTVTDDGGFFDGDSGDGRYDHMRKMGIFKTIESPNNFKLMSILTRIRRKQEHFQAKIDRKKRAEREWFDNKHGKVG